MNVTLYGSSRSRASRALWLLRELDIPFNHIEDKASSSINPNQKIPSLYKKMEKNHSISTNLWQFIYFILFVF